MSQSVLQRACKHQHQVRATSLIPFSEKSENCEDIFMYGALYSVVGRGTANAASFRPFPGFSMARLLNADGRFEEFAPLCLTRQWRRNNPLSFKAENFRFFSLVLDKDLQYLTEPACPEDFNDSQSVRTTASLIHLRGYLRKCPARTCSHMG